MTDFVSATKVLGIALKHREALNQVVTELSSEQFPANYREFAKIFIELSKRKITVTEDVLASTLDAAKVDSATKINIQKVFTECANASVDVGEFNYYVDELKKQKADRILRDILSGRDENDNPIKVKGVVQPSVVELLKDHKDPFAAAKQLKKAISDIEQLGTKDPIIRVNMKDRWQNKLKEYEERKVDKSKAVGILTGFGPLDDMTRGIHPGEMFLFAGRPGTGKSICLVNAAKKMFIDGKNVLLFSLEMPFEQYEDRFMACYGGLNAKRMMLGALSTEEEAKLKEKWQHVGEARNHFEIIDFPKVNSIRIENEISRVLDRYTPDVVVVDYLGIMKPNDKGSVADWEVQGRIAEELRQVARIYKVPMISAVQLNRSKDKTADTDRLSRSDIIAQTADAIIMINDKSKDDDALSDLMKLTVIKNRKGESNFEFEMFKNFETITIENVPSYKSTLEGLLLPPPAAA